MVNPSHIEEILPLSPLQEGLLFHALYDGPEADGPADPYLQQLPLELEGDLDTSRLRAAFEALLTRHPNLRAGFIVRHNGQPVQVIPAATTIPWTQTDLTTLTPRAQHDHIKTLLATDRRHRFNPATPPLIRIHITRLAPRRHILIITSHHILWDGWSMSRALTDLFTLYHDPAALPDPAPFRDYLAWLTVQDHTAAEKAWASALHGITEPTLVAPGLDPSLAVLPARVEHTLTTALTTALTATARARSLTLNTIIQGAWALLLSTLTGQHDITFGATVSGRPPQIPGIEDIVGLLINTIPVRATITPRTTLAGLLTTIQQQQTDLTPHHYLSLTTIQRQTPHPQNLFDTTTAFQSHGRAGRIPRQADGDRLRIRPAGELLTGGYRGGGAYHYALRLVVFPEPELGLELCYRPEAFDAKACTLLLERLKTILEAFVTDIEMPAALIHELDSVGVRLYRPTEPRVSAG
jgi:hypothetical protein